jgi:hypothetical protein
MNNKNLMQLGVLVALVAVYVIFFTDWFKPRLIHIAYTCRNSGRALRHPETEAPDTVPVLFNLGEHYKLTELKAYRLSEWATNHAALPVWHLVSSSNSIPVDRFGYGQYIRGMSPAVPGTHPEPLEPDVVYHLIVQAGKIKGEHDFSTKPSS